MQSATSIASTGVAFSDDGGSMGPFSGAFTRSTETYGSIGGWFFSFLRLVVQSRPGPVQYVLLL